VLWLETHPMATGPDKLLVDVADPPAAHPTNRVNPKRDRRVGGRSASRNSKPDDGTVPHDVA
jgi:hypothetical protein